MKPFVCRNILELGAIRLLGMAGRVLYRGDHFECPLCKAKLRAFLPLPPQFRRKLTIDGAEYSASDYETLNIDNYMCPVCRCSDRERLIATYLAKTRHQSRNKIRLIHFAPERSLSRFIATNEAAYDYVTADLAMTGVDLRLDMTHMADLSDSSFDCFICSHILEHIDDDMAALRELFRILAPGGSGVFLSPIIPSLTRTHEDPSIRNTQDRLTHFGQKDHVRVYAKRDFVSRIGAAGFKVSELGREFFVAETLAKAGIQDGSVLYVGSKGGA